MSEESVIFLAEVSSPRADNKSAVQAAVSPSLFAVPEEKVAEDRGEESPMGGPEGPTEVGGVCETEAGTEADMEDEDEDVDVVGGVDEVGSLDTILTDSRSQRSFVERDWKRMCPNLHKVSFEIFLNYH